MATIKKLVKAQMGKDVPKDKARTEMGDLVDRKEFLKRQDSMADNLDRLSGKGKYAPKANPAINNKPMGMKDIDKKEYNKLPEYKPKQKNGGKMAKAKSGGSFPDLNKDGKITKADILKGRGVIAKKGAKVAKKAMPCASCGKSMKKK
jgi:hypothetical protein